MNERDYLQCFFFHFFSRARYYRIQIHRHRGHRLDLITRGEINSRRCFGCRRKYGCILKSRWFCRPIFVGVQIGLRAGKWTTIKPAEQAAIVRCCVGVLLRRHANGQRANVDITRRRYFAGITLEKLANELGSYNVITRERQTLHRRDTFACK